MEAQSSRALTVAALLLALALTPPAGAVTLTAPDGGPAGAPWQTWADEAQVPTPPGTVIVHTDDSPCPAWTVGCAQWWPDSDRADIWILPAALDPRRVELHELGHIFDARVMTDAARDAWRVAAIQHIPGWPAVREDGSTICALTCERFAESYAWCAVLGGHVTDSVYGIYGYVAGPVRQRRACRVMRLAAAGAFGAGRMRGLEARAPRQQRTRTATLAGTPSWPRCGVTWHWCNPSRRRSPAVWLGVHLGTLAVLPVVTQKSLPSHRLL